MILHDGWELNSRPIRMPFPPPSALSGYNGAVGNELHFGAVDQIAEVFKK